jgi:hypothetical protein
VTVSPDELTGTEQAVLLVLMAKARPVPNPELKKLGPELKQRERVRLNRLKLIETTSGRPMVHELTDKGWATCRDLVGAAAPARVTGQGKVLYTVLIALDRYLRRENLTLAEIFETSDIETTDIDTYIESRVRQTYSRLVSRPGGWLGLAKLRAELTDVPRAELDAALVRLYQAPGVSLIPEENQKTLTAADRAAAVEIGTQHQHLIAIEP